MKMKSIKRGMAIMAGCMLMGSHQAQAIVLDFSTVPGATVEFTGNTNTFQFLNDGSGNGFSITSATPGGSSVGFFGNIAGTFTIGTISGGAVQTAPVTGTGTLTITDGAAFSLTADIDMVSIFSLGAIGGTNAGTVANVSNISYAGSDADLTAWVTGLGQTGTISYQFNGGHSLALLTTDGLVHSTSYSGSLANKTPEAGSSVTVLGIALLGLAGLRRKFMAA